LDPQTSSSEQPRGHAPSESAALTSVSDRAVFVEGVSDLLLGLAGDRTLVVMTLNLDHFSELTFARGHATGQLILKEVSERLSERLTPLSAIAWTAGDVFVIACELVDASELLQPLPARVLSCFDAPFVVASVPLYLSASVGVAFSTVGHNDPQKLLDSADIACAEARRAGGHRIAVFDRPARIKTIDKFEMTQDLHRCVEHGELSLDYQPIIQLPSRTIVGQEVLTRWKPRGQKEIVPEYFMPLAEESGLMASITSWTLGEIVRMWSHLPTGEGTLGQPFLALSVSADQLDSGFTTLSEELISAAVAVGARFSVQITESSLTIDPLASQASLTWLKSQGLGVIVEKFGTPVSSLRSLREFPIDAIKISQSFISRIHESERDQTIVGSIIDLAHKLEMSTIAVGVESEAQLDCLVALGCDQVQGSLLVPPFLISSTGNAPPTESTLVRH
jgi:diguanylate cyclase (GGDEF)-like protein